MFTPYRSLHLSHTYFHLLLCVRCSVKCLYMEMKKIWLPPQGTHRLVGEIDKKSEISMDDCRVSQEGKSFRDSNTSFHLKPCPIRKTVLSITRDNILLFCPPITSLTLILLFSQYLLPSQLKTMSPTSNVLAQLSDLIPDQTPYVSEMQFPDAFVPAFMT